ncbi:54S ribosomal protein L36, mitochondrial [Diplodia seriata]|uniref:54S ribosomal protein L36, mitochondrial n=1 Tax=Diplodia seriata TaxID=420778 RepID=A0A1S8BED2_9PEZI|nr:54S ribosomal protein L36, mitochondrial [Diplodia seriata]
MPPSLTSSALTAHRLGSNASALLPKTQCRHATLLRRPKRPYTFTQLITLSDGSTYLHRTTSPAPVYRSTKDIRNHPLWNPSSQKLMNVEEDEAGRLRAFRARFGRGWDSEVHEDPEQVGIHSPASWGCCM